ncbi:MAG: hypothetical protein EBX20_08285, partial [Rhodobacterales bacterium]|nr:hypothetical protein [Rhodobacterales bacterium]
EPDIHHHRKADDLGAGLEITKWAALCHGAEPRTRPPTAQGWFNLTMPDPEFIGPIKAPDYLPLEFQIIFIRSVLKNWIQPDKEHFAFRDEVRF